MNSYLQCTVPPSENRKRANMEFPQVCQAGVQKHGCAGISLAGFQTKIAVFGDGSSLLYSVSMWAVQLQCPLTNNSMSYFPQGFQSSWVQDLKECHAVVAELTGTERNRKRWQSIFEINTWTLADKKPCQKKDGVRAKSLRHLLLPCRLPIRNSGLN